jgi:hypothetical protein
MKTLTTILLSILLPVMAMAQTVETISPKKGYQPPDREDWLNAGLIADEYDYAVRYEVSLEEWKKMHTKRNTHRTAGWALVGVGLLIPAVEATIHFASDLKFQNHPEQEVYIMCTVAAGLSILTGIVLVASAPGPEDFKSAWFRKAGRASVWVSPTSNGALVGFHF